MDFMNRRANGAAARMWAAAAESGIGPHDPLAPFIDAMGGRRRAHRNCRR